MIRNGFATIFITMMCLVAYSHKLYDVDMVRDLKNYYDFKWIIIQSCKKTDYQIIRLMKDIESKMNVYVTVFMWEDFMDQTVLNKDFKPLVLVSCLSCPSDCLLRIIELNHLSRFVWLSMNTTKTTSMASLHIPLDCLFLFAEEHSHENYTFAEMYQTSPQSKWIYNRVGYWSPQGYYFTPVPLIERRSNFHGQKIMTLFERDDSKNRLISIYKHHVPCYFNLAKRLNFVVQSTTDTEEDYDVSLYMRFTDSKSNDTLLQPLYTSSQAIFFKDKGMRMQLDGYLQAFELPVWLSIIAVTLLTGFASYFTSRILRRVTRSTAYRADMYFYQSFYILFQKHEISESSTTQKIITLSQWVTSIYILSCYSAIFISFISVSIPKPPFTTVDGILKQRNYNIVSAKYIISGTSDSIKYSRDEKLRKLYETHFDPAQNLKEDPVTFFCKHDKYIFITSEHHMSRVRRENRHCSVSQTRIKLHLRHLSWSVPPGSQYKRFFEFYLFKLRLSGSLKDHFIKTTTFRNLPEPVTFRSIDLNDVVILFIILSAGICISIILYYVETLHERQIIFSP